MNDYRVWLAIGGFLLAGRLLLPVLAGDRSSQVREDDYQQVVYVCRDSGETFLLKAKSAPEKHPRTGQPTLWPGLYCESCKAWKFVGPLESLQASGKPPLCPRHNSPLTLDGPQP